MQTNKINNLRRNITINFLLITILLISSKISAQNDTIFFDQNWKKTNKETALYYRIKPLQNKDKPGCWLQSKKYRSLYIIKDYYLKDNTLQFEGYSKDPEGEHLIGNAKWFSEDGNLIESRDFTYKQNGDSPGFKIPEWPILFVDYKIAVKSQFTGGLEFCLDCENKNKLFLGVGFGVTSYNHTYYGLPDFHLSYNREILFVKSGLSDKHAYALAGVTLLNIIDLGFGYSQPFNNDKIPVIKGFTFGTTFRFSRNQKAYTQIRVM
ncbi:hypothetical protein NJT12_21340 [Flavobacterium sp. AC]|uniref:DUF3575 domain-containing protein n=1 Tax=Flavobacterium azizsancarii TaxID=2961580 RepID=A0ABT4WI94_9FLAO|nr:hypothetical protein [Flavobacterium azizsancarii]MDA6072176.1 hypothetical protein [Flavobacterium azizsancarii]